MFAARLAAVHGSRVLLECFLGREVHAATASDRLALLSMGLHLVLDEGLLTLELLPATYELRHVKFLLGFLCFSHFRETPGGRM